MDVNIMNVSAEHWRGFFCLHIIRDRNFIQRKMFADFKVLFQQSCPLQSSTVKYSPGVISRELPARTKGLDQTTGMILSVTIVSVSY